MGMLEFAEMGGQSRHVVAAVASLAATIERAASDLALAEEPSNFVVALEQASPGE